MSKKQIQGAGIQGVLNMNIFHIVGLSDLTKDHKIELLRTMMTVIHQRVAARIADTLPPDALEKLQSAIDEKRDGTITALLAAHSLPSFAELMAEEALLFKHEMNALRAGDAVLLDI